MFYIFDGDDSLSRRETLIDLQAKMGEPATAQLNTTYLDGRSVTLAQLQHHCNTIPFGADRRMVIVTGLLERLASRNIRPEDTSFLSELVDYLPTLPATTRLILVEETKLATNHPILVLARDRADAHIKTFTKPQGSVLIRWVQDRAKQVGGSIDPAAAQALCSFVGDDLYQLGQEVEKLVAYSGGKRPVDADDVQLLTPAARQASIFDLVDALGRRDARTASRKYHDLLAAGEHPLALLAMVTRQYRLMIQVKELEPSLHTANAIARYLQQNPYPIRKILAQSRNYTLNQLHTVYHTLAETDADIKTGRVDATLAIDTLIAEVGRRAIASTRLSYRSQ